MYYVSTSVSGAWDNSVNPTSRSPCSWGKRYWFIDLVPWWLSGKEPACQCRRCGFDPWVGKNPWRRQWQLTPIFLPGESHRQRSLVGYSLWGRKESDTTEQLNNNHPQLQHSCEDCYQNNPIPFSRSVGLQTLLTIKGTLISTSRCAD